MSLMKYQSNKKTYTSLYREEEQKEEEKILSLEKVYQI